MALTLRERVEKRLVGLKRVREPYEAEWKEIAQHAQPSRSRFLFDDTNRTFRRSNRAIYNSHGIVSFRTQAAGLTAGLSSPSRPWFRLTTFDEAALDDPETRDWLSEVEKRMYAFLSQTNFYEVAKSGYAEVGMFGTEAGVLEERNGTMVGHALTVGEYWTALGDMEKPDTLYRRVPMTAVQQIQCFGYANVAPRIRDAYDNSNYEMATKVMHAIEPNDEIVHGVLTAKGKPWRSFYWDTEDGDKQKGQLRLAGFDDKPFWASRWDTVGGDTYGTSPGMEALPDLRELQLSTKRANLILAKIENPEKVVPSTLKLTGQPGNVVSVASVDKDSVIVPYIPSPVALEKAEEKVARLEQKVDEVSFASLFNAITDMAGIQPRNEQEIAARIEEKMTQLGAAIERVNGEKLQPAIDRTFGIMSRLGMLPPAPPHLQGQAIKIDFVSILTQMQRMIGLGQVERVMSFVGSVSAEFPEAKDKVNIDKTIDDYADRAGAPPKMIRSDEEVEAIREARQNQQNMAAAASAMPAVKDGAEAATILADAANKGGGPLNLLPSAA